MDAQVGEAAARAQAAGYLAYDGGEVLGVGLEVHSGRDIRAGVRDGEAPGVGPHGGGQPGPGEPQLVGGDIEPDGAVACVSQEPAGAPGAAGHVEAYRGRVGAEDLPEPGLLLFEVERRGGLVVP